MHVYAYVCICMHVYAYVYACVCICMHVYAYACMCRVNMYELRKLHHQVFDSKSLLAIQACGDIILYIYICIYIYIHTYTYTYNMHTQTYTHTFCARIEAACLQLAKS